MDDSKSLASHKHILHDDLVAELAEAVEKRLASLNISQASIWLAGYVMGRLASDCHGMAIDVFTDPLVISLLDTSDPTLIDMIATREAGG